MPPRFPLRRSRTEPVVVPNPDQAWKLLSLTNEWIRHSDAKAAVTLAFTGVMGTMIFNLVKDFVKRSFVFDFAVIVAGCLLVLTAAFCAWTLTPRVKDQDASPEDASLLFFGSIAVKFKNDRGTYREVLSSMTADPAALTRDLTDQIHANAKIAAVKSRAVQRAIRSALGAAATVSIIAVVIGVSNL